MQYQEKDEIVPIPAHRVRFFGTEGTMLLPSPATIASVIEKVPASKLITTDLLRQTLQDEFEVDAVCPVTTRKSLHVVARDDSHKVAYWRVINQSGGLMAQYPGGVEEHAALLRKEGITIDTAGKSPKVKQFKERLVRFA